MPRLSQAEIILTALSTEILRESLSAGAVGPRGNRDEFEAPNSVFPCAGDDEWCVIAVRNQSDWENLLRVMGRSDLLADSRFSSHSARAAHVDELERIVSEWKMTRSPVAVMEKLQAVGVPAAAMQRIDEFSKNPHFLARNFFRKFEQPGLPTAILTENGPVAYSSLPDPDLRPAPFFAQHTEIVAQHILKMTREEIDALIAHGVLETMPQEYQEFFPTLAR